MGPVEADGHISVSVAYSPGPGSVDEVALSLRSNATVLDALRASGLLQRHPSIDLTKQRVGVWGKLTHLGDALRENDRVEIYRPLLVDPKEARRLRYRRQRERNKR